MTVVEIMPHSRTCVSRVSVQVSEYSVANGGNDSETLYTVEVLFPDGTWKIDSHHRNLGDAWIEAACVANDRGALLLPQSLWPSRQVGG